MAKPYVGRVPGNSPKTYPNEGNVCVHCHGRGKLLRQVGNRWYPVPCRCAQEAKRKGEEGG